MKSKTKLALFVLASVPLLVLLSLFGTQQMSSAHAAQNNIICITIPKAGTGQQKLCINVGHSSNCNVVSWLCKPGEATPPPAKTPVPPMPTPPAPPTPKPIPPAPPAQTPAPQPGTGTPASQAAQAVFDAINKQRAGAGLPALQWNDKLAQSAKKHNQAMIGANSLAHQVAGEAALGERITQVGLQWSSVAENIGYGTGDATTMAVQLNQQMFDEQAPNDGHRRNILSNNTLLGVDVTVDQNGKVWLTEDFARP